MIFSYSLLKSYVSLPPKEKLIDLLSNRAIEAEDGETKDTLDVSIPANRYSDAASYWGLAKIIYAITGKKAKIPAIKSKKEFKNAADNFSVSITSKKGCKAMHVIYFEDLKLKESPAWLKKALKDNDIQSINNLVDITNFVMIETGQPMHALDYDKIQGQKLIIRDSKKGEETTTLDGKLVKLDPSIVVIADNKIPLDIGGVKGSKPAAITNETKKVLLTAGTFDGPTVYRSIRKTKIITDAGKRFSHDLSPALPKIALNRATDLIEELCKGKSGQAIAVGKTSVKEKIVTFDLEKFNKLTGLKLSLNQCLIILKRLGFPVKGKEVTIPVNRTDIEIVQDLFEEVVNIYGYENFPEIKPYFEKLDAKLEPFLNFKKQIKHLLYSYGLAEVRNYSFVSKEEIGKDKAYELENYLSSNHSHLRRSLIGGIRRNLKDNLRFYKRVDIYEIGTVFLPENKESEVTNLAIASTVNVDDFVQKFMIDLDIDEKHIIHQNGKVIEFNLNEIFKDIKIFSTDHKPEKKKFVYKVFSRYPEVLRDLSLIIPLSTQNKDITDSIIGENLEKIETIKVTEKGKGIPENMKNLLLRLKFQSFNKTLTDKEVNERLRLIEKELKIKFQVKIK